MTLKGQRVIIVGGSSGMGLATAHAAAAAGAAVTIASSNQERLTRALAQLPDDCDAVRVDIRCDAEVDALFSHVGAFDHLVLTAADALPLRPLKDLPLEEAQQGFLVRFWGAVSAVKHAVPHLNRGGSIVLTSGTIGVRPAPGAALAAAGAGAIEGLTRGLAVELAPVRVNAVRPGVIRTPMWDGLPDEQRESLFATLAQSTLTKTIGEPNHIAATHLYLMQTSFVTGAVLTVDGGSLLART